MLCVYVIESSCANYFMATITPYGEGAIAVFGFNNCPLNITVHLFWRRNIGIP
eukprot:GDKH01009356.1.p2 GENE.GDKH01009356.1~~GDKH01009356.1.p2  ORF type:complete len:53 (+),score=1.63 GDKH01009356.1:38-196(+)